MDLKERKHETTLQNANEADILPEQGLEPIHSSSSHLEIDKIDRQARPATTLTQTKSLEQHVSLPREMEA